MTQPSSQRSNLKFVYLFLAIIITVLIVGGGLYMWASQKQSKLNEKIIDLQNEINQPKQQVDDLRAVSHNDNQNNSQDFSTKYYEYKLQTQYGEKWDLKLIRRDRQTGEETVVIASIKEVIPDLKAEFNLLLSDFAHPKDSRMIIFKSVLSSTDNPKGVLYSFNTENNKFTKMNVNDVYNGFFGCFALSPDQTKFVWTHKVNKDGNPSTEVMHLFDLINDEYKAVVNLSENETFDAAYDTMGSYCEMVWVNEEKIKYAVFDQSKKIKGYDSSSEAARKSILIEYREFNP